MCFMQEIKGTNNMTHKMTTTLHYTATTLMYIERDASLGRWGAGGRGKGRGGDEFLKPK